jgi:hypothetical protein
MDTLDNNKISRREYMKKYREEHRDKYKEYRNKWRQTHKDDEERKAKNASYAKLYYQRLKAKKNIITAPEPI